MHSRRPLPVQIADCDGSHWWRHRGNLSLPASPRRLTQLCRSCRALLPHGNSRIPWLRTYRGLRIPTDSDSTCTNRSSQSSGIKQYTPTSVRYRINSNLADERCWFRCKIASELLRPCCVPMRGHLQRLVTLLRSTTKRTCSVRINRGTDIFNRAPRFTAPTRFPDFVGPSTGFERCWFDSNPD